MIWFLLLIIMTIGMWVFRYYCINNTSNDLLKILLPIANIIAIIILYFIIFPFTIGISVYDIYIHPIDKLYYIVSISFIIVLISNLIDLYNKNRIWKTKK